MLWPHAAQASWYAYSVPRTEQTRIGMSPAVMQTGRALGGPISASVTQLPWPPAATSSAAAGVSGRMPICSRTGAGAAGASVIPSTTTSVTSGAASLTAPSIASCTVTAEEGQPLQLPSSVSRATPSVTPV